MIIKKFLNYFLNIIFPINCLICNKGDKYLCNDCFKKIPILDLKYNNINYLDDIFIATSYKNKIINNLLIYFKYKHIKEFGLYLGNFISLYFNGKISSLYFSNTKEYNNLCSSFLTYIPSRKIDKRKRGYCPSEILMIQVAKNSNFVCLDALKINKKKKRQAGLNKRKRIQNMKNSFQIKNKEIKKVIQYKNIILVDDVISTGSTIYQAAKTLKDNGAKKVYALILSKN